MLHYINEEFLSYVWLFRRYLPDITTVDGSLIEVLHTGTEHTDAGPDFMNARIKIGNTLWAGNVELHVRSSDWYLHGHDDNPLYKNIILHVVYENDKPVFNNQGLEIPVLELKKYIDSALIANYQSFVLSRAWAPCEKLIAKTDGFVRSAWLEALSVERLQQKTAEICHRLESSKYDWEQVFYEWLARNFGFHTNAVPFEMLARSLPYKKISKIKNDLFKLEALYFGQAGMLVPGIKDDYFQDLRKEYGYYVKAWELQPMDVHVWKFLRLRPVNFPSVRISQFAALMHTYESLFSKIIESESIDELQRVFMPEASEYWKHHYNFGLSSPDKSTRPGLASVYLIIINTVIPFLFAYGALRNDEAIKDKALMFSEKVPAESNSIISKWGERGIKAVSSRESQALLQLRTKYCLKRKCLQCRIGDSVLKMKEI